MNRFGASGPAAIAAKALARSMSPPGGTSRMVVEPFQFAPEPPPRPAPPADHHGEDAPCLAIQRRRCGIEIGEELEREGVERQWAMGAAPVLWGALRGARIDR